MVMLKSVDFLLWFRAAVGPQHSNLGGRRRNFWDLRSPLSQPQNAYLLSARPIHIPIHWTNNTKNYIQSTTGNRNRGLCWRDDRVFHLDLGAHSGGEIAGPAIPPTTTPRRRKPLKRRDRRGRLPNVQLRDRDWARRNWWTWDSNSARDP